MRLLLDIVVSLLLVKLIQAQVRLSKVEEISWRSLNIDWQNSVLPDSFSSIDVRNLIVEHAVRTWDNRTIVSIKPYKRFPTLYTLEPRERGVFLIPYPDRNFFVGDTCTWIMEVRALLIDDERRLWVLSKGSGGCSDTLVVISLTENRPLAANSVPGTLNARPSRENFFNRASMETHKIRPNVTIYYDDVSRLLRLKVGLRSVNDNYELDITSSTMEKLNDPSGTRIQNGLSSLSLSPYTCPSSIRLTENAVNPDHYLYFGVLPENNMYRMPINFLGAGRIEPVKPNYKATVQVISQDGVVFHNLFNKPGIGCYNFHNPPPMQFNEFSLTAVPGGFYSSLKTYLRQNNNNKQEERLMAFYKLNPDDVNVSNRFYSIITVSVDDITRQINCNKL